MSSKLTALTTNPAPAITDLLYTVPAAGGNQYKAALSAYSLVVGPASATSNTVPVFSGTTGKIVKVPDGPINITAGGTNESVTITPSGTGNIDLVFNTSTLSPAFRGAHVTGIAATTTGYTIDTFGANSVFNGRRANGTITSPSAVLANEVLLNLGARGFGATAYSAGSRVNLSFSAMENWTDSVQSSYFQLQTTLRGTATTYTPVIIGLNSFIEINNSATGVAQPAWGLKGPVISCTASTFTDTSTAGSGTATTAAFSSFAVPTLAATNTLVTTTNAATVYIAGAPAAGTNQTITNGYALWIGAGGIKWDTTANVGVAVASTHTANINIGGTVYKILLSNV